MAALTADITTLTQLWHSCYNTFTLNTNQHCSTKKSKSFMKPLQYSRSAEVLNIIMISNSITLCLKCSQEKLLYSTKSQQPPRGAPLIEISVFTLNKKSCKCTNEADKEGNVVIDASVLVHFP